MTKIKLRKIKLENTETIIRAHLAKNCKGPVCSLHNRSNHPMRDFPQSFRFDRYLMERICPHGIGHPDPDDPKISMGHGDPENNYDLVHGCDGCCDGSYK